MATKGGSKFFDGGEANQGRSENFQNRSTPVTYLMTRPLQEYCSFTRGLIFLVFLVFEPWNILMIFLFYNSLIRLKV